MICLLTGRSASSPGSLGRSLGGFAEDSRWSRRAPDRGTPVGRSVETDAHQRLGVRRQPLEAQVSIEGSRIRVVDGDIQMHAADASRAQVGEQPLDERPSETLAPRPFHQVDMEVGRDSPGPPRPGARGGRVDDGR